MCNDVRPRRRGHRGFSLVEVITATAVLGLVSAGVLQTLAFVARENGDARLRTNAALEAMATLDRVIMMRAGARSVGADDSLVCALLEARDGPMDATTGGVASGVCPQRIVENIPSLMPGLLRTVALSKEPLGTITALRVSVSIGFSSRTPLLTGRPTVTIQGVIRP